MKTWTTMDKSDWPERGHWDSEPDKAQWIDEATKLDCLIVRGPLGALCGYVGVPESHKHFEDDYLNVDVDVHGGLTFADRCQPTNDESRHICHSGEVANKTVWWLGFDCAHAWDVTPMHPHSFGWDSIYRDFEYVKREVTHLAHQLSNIKEVA